MLFIRIKTYFHFLQYCTNTTIMLSAVVMQGMKRFDARKHIEIALRELGLYRGDVDHEMLLPVCRFVAFSAIYFSSCI